MRPTSAALFAMLLIIAAAVVSAQFSSPLHHSKQYARSFAPFTTYTNVTAAQLLDIYNKGPVYIVDVREQDEFKAGHIPGALNYPLSTIDQTWELLPADRTVYVHCKGGFRSLKAIAILETKPIIAKLVNVSDGFDAWKGPVESDTDPAQAPPQVTTKSTQGFESMLEAIYAMGLATPQRQQPQQPKKAVSSFDSLLLAMEAMDLHQQQTKQRPQAPTKSTRSIPDLNVYIEGLKSMGF